MCIYQEKYSQGPAAESEIPNERMRSWNLCGMPGDKLSTKCLSANVVGLLLWALEAGLHVGRFFKATLVRAGDSPST